MSKDSATSRGVSPMSSHEEFRELCAAAIAGELTSDEQAKLDAKEDVSDGYEKEEDTSTVECLQAYADELDGIITRLEAVEEKYNPGLKESAAKIDADFQKYAELMAEVDAA